ncbi:hypothetical protein VP01_405g7 [Puccinia sorghi]|uniref:Uncharacterized protein n=1 Tax=Puccinia sorghi TaxID=27349 RepID=A0A0L6USF3_9BASI|nr:hypothetical protein VP01_405g7 [Puccinia sorghi]
MTHSYFCVFWVVHRPAPILLSHLEDSLDSQLKMIYPNLKENKVENPIHIAGISDAKEIFENSKKQVEVAKIFGISDRQVQHIISYSWSNSSASTNQHRAKSKLTNNVVTSILFFLKDNPSTTLKKLTKHVKDKHEIQVLLGAIQKMPKTIQFRRLSPPFHAR